MLLGSLSILVTLPVEIRSLAQDELEIVERVIAFDWGNSKKHRNRLRMQRLDKLVYLIAWVECQPAGHAALEWAGKEHASFIGKISNCPNIDDLFVHPEQRGKAIGTQLLNKAESLVVHRGYSRVGIGVNTCNYRSMKLYESLGYCESGVGEYIDRWQYIERDGRRRWYQESCNYLVKNLQEVQSKSIRTSLI